MQPPQSFTKLPSQQQRFVLLKAGGAPNIEAAQGAYNCETTDSAKTIACRLMAEPDINVAIRDILAQEGYPIRKRLKRLGELIDCADLTIAGRGLDMSFKLDGSYAPIQVVEIQDYRSINIELSGTLQELAQTISEGRKRLAELREMKAAEQAEVVEGETTDGN
jgi:hypothetical protein